MSIIDTLVTDRTQADVDRLAAAQKAANKGTATAEQLALVKSDSPKGGYDYTDLNRVGEAVQYLADILTERGYSVPVTAKTDWTKTDGPKIEDMQQYLNDLATLHDAFQQLETTPDTPDTLQKLDFEMANNIEKILMAIDDAMDRMGKSHFYTGEIYSGEV